METKPPIRARLRAFMEIHQLTSKDVADTISVSVNTVNMWRSRTGNDMPENLFELLRLKTERN